jgi:hypothetical protein
MHGTSDMHYRSAVHGSFARDDCRGARDLSDDPNLENPELSQAAVLRELAWVLAGCAAVIIAVNILGALLAAH